MKDVRTTEEIALRVRQDLVAGQLPEEAAEKLVKDGWARREALDFVEAVRRGDVPASRAVRMPQVGKQAAWGVAAIVWGAGMLVLGFSGVDIVGPWMFAGVGLIGFGIYRLVKAYGIWRGP
jgi:hypothetical protein